MDARVESESAWYSKAARTVSPLEMMASVAEGHTGTAVNGRTGGVGSRTDVVAVEGNGVITFAEVNVGVQNVADLAMSIRSSPAPIPMKELLIA